MLPSAVTYHVNHISRADAQVRRLVKAGLRLAVVVPCYNVQEHIDEVVHSIPDYIACIILVNDASTDASPGIMAHLAAEDSRVQVIHLDKNRGVGGAMMAGFAKACELQADIVIKMDGDGQMDPIYLPLLIVPLTAGKADYTKGNRFYSVFSLAQMPLVRRLGNAVLSLTIKIVSGYWNVFDPANGYVAIRREILERLPAAMIHWRYFFESSMLIALGIMGAVVLDVPMDARYGREKSGMRVGQTLVEFPIQLGLGFLRRIWLRKILYSLTMEAILGISGCLFFLAGFIFGVVEFYHYAIVLKVAAPSGTVMTAALPVLLGFQMILNAILLDIQSTPRVPLCDLWEPNVGD